MALLALASCGENSGLGASVDTEAPTVGITYPPSLAIIRHGFVFGGSWSDDKGLKNIAVEVFKSNSDETKTSVYQADAAISKDGTWQIALNEYDAEKYVSSNGWQFIDGDYEIQATAKDNAGHSSSTVSRSFSIDNTPPVLVLTKPTTVGSNTPRTYGRTVQLEGTFSENCSSGISNLKVSFYDVNGEKLFDSEFEGITDMSNANPLVIAQYYDADQEPDSSSENYQKWQNYQKIYTEENIASYRNDGTDLTEQLYFSVTASDAAKIYNDFEGGTSIAGGNMTATFYRGTTAMLNLVNAKNADFPGFSVATLKNYINKTDTTYLENAALKEIIDAAASVSVNTSEKVTISDSISNISTETADGTAQEVYLTFSMNPKNNPTFTISGLSLQPDTTDTENYTDEYYNYYSDSTINVSIAPGLDLTNISTSSVTVYYTKEGTSDKQILWTWNEEKAIEYAMTTNNLSEEAAKTAIAVDPATYRYTPTDSDANTDTLSKSTTLSATKNEIIYRNKYDFSIEGVDIDGQNLVASDSAGFGFYAKSNAAAPVVTIGAEEKASYKNLQTLTAITDKVVTEGKLAFSGTVKSASELQENGMTYSISLTDTSDSSKTKAVSGEIEFTLQEETQYVYDWAFSFTPSDEMKSIIASGLYTINVEITASNGEKGSASRTYYLDNVAPSISNVAISGGYTKGEIIYINNTKPFIVSGTTTDNYLLDSTTFVFTGASDSGEATPVSGNSSNISWTGEGIDLSGFKATSEDSDAILTVTATDGAENSVSEDFKIKFDTTAPAGKHRWTQKSENASKKDLIFRVGESDNDLSELTAWDSSLTALDSTLDKDVGGKYSAGTWGNAQTITIRGDWIEEGSGVKMIYYKIFTSDEADYKGPSEADLSEFLATYASSKDGYFEPLSETITRRVSYTDGGGNASFAEIVSSFKTTISGFSKGNNYLALVAVDNVGNAGIDTLAAINFNDSADSAEGSTEWNDSLGAFSLNVDTESPTVLSKKSGAHYTNTVNAIDVTGTFSDADSGVKSVYLTVNGTQLDNATLDSENSTWGTTIPLAVLEKFVDGQVYNVNATVTDNAGNTSSSTIFTLQVDREAPNVRITTPTVASSVNGTISISGTVPAANIGAIPDSMELYYTTTEPNSSTTLSDLTKVGDTIDDATQIYSWTFEKFNTESAFTASEANLVTKKVYIVPVIYDEADNCNIYTETSDGTRTYSFKKGDGSSDNKGNYFEYTIDRNADRPIIQLTSVEKADSWLGSATIRGSISDDDGIASFAISQDGSSWTSVTVTNGSWSYVITGGDGTEIPLHFKVVDTEGTTFTTGSTRFNRPYYFYASTTQSELVSGEYGLDNEEAIKVNLDTGAPKIATEGLVIGKNCGDYSESNTEGLISEATVASEPSSSAYMFGASRYAGGNSKYIKIYVPAYDGNLDKVTISISNEEGKVETTKYKTVDSSEEKSAITADTIELSATTQEITTGGVTYTYYASDVIDVSEATTGTKTMTISVTDKANNETKSTKTFAVDNTGPEEITITSPASTDEVTGTVQVVGTANDIGVGIDSIEWLVPPKSYTASMTDEQLIALDGWNSSNNTKSVSVFNFRFTAGSSTDLVYFDDTENYAVTLNKTTNIYKIPLFFKTTDTLGNVYIKRDYFITHNPDADRPVTGVSYPTANDYDENCDTTNYDYSYITLAGVIRASGTVEIPSGTTTVGKVYIQLGKVAKDGSVDWANYATNFKDEIITLGSSEAKEISDVVKTNSDIINEYNLFGTNDEIAKKYYIADDWWGIPVTTKTTTWNVTLNAKGKLEPSGDDPNPVAIRLCAVNADGKMGLWTDTTIDPVYIHVDNGAPSQSAVMRQYNFEPSALTTANATTTGNIKVQKDYSTEMYLKGTWYLTVTLQDNDSIVEKNITVKRSSVDVDYAETKITDKVIEGKTYKVKTLFIPIETTSIPSSNVSYTVYVEDESAHSSTMTYSFYIDNTAPQITSVFKGSSLAEDESNKIVENSEIADSNYIYTLGGKVDETGSGFDKVVFYYVRDADFKTPAILDPFITTGQKDAKAVIATDGLTTIDVADDENLKLYGKKLEGGTTTIIDASAGKYTFTHSDVSGNAHIRVGGLIHIGGDFGVITEISGTEVSFKTNSTVSTSDTEAFFPYAQVVDNTGIEKASKTSGTDFEFESGDDGDNMPETISGSKATGFTWTGIMHTTNIPDGPVNLVVLAFDVAGNVGIRTTRVNIVNNAPRLAKLYLGTDLNMSGTWTSNEFVGYNINTSFAENITVNKELTTGGFKIKKDLAVAA